MSTKENTLQLSPQFTSASCSKSASETEYSSFKKWEKWSWSEKENEVPLKETQIKSLSGKVWSK